MRIAIVAPLAEPVPPPLYGGTERVVSYLTEELVRRGHEVTLFANGDSKTSAKLVPCSARVGSDPTMATIFELGQVYRGQDRFEVIHNHAGWLALAFAELVATPTITTVHYRLDQPEMALPFGHYPEHHLVSISHSQRQALPGANWVGTVHNGTDISHYTLCESPGHYLMFLGRLSPDKGPEAAVEIAEKAGMRLIVAAKVDPADQAYFDDVISPLFRRSPFVDFVGEVNDSEKDQLLGNAYACLFPINWPEPFGLTMIESMATGTPVIAMAKGSAPEVIVNGKTGFLCTSTAEMLGAIELVSSIDRRACRRWVEESFSAELMTDRYEAIYSRVLQGKLES